MNSCNDTEYFSKKGDYLGMKNCNSNNNTNINNSSNIRHNNFFQNTTQQRRNFNYKMSFSSENDSSDMSDDDEEESVGKEKSKFYKNINYGNFHYLGSILSMNKNSKLIKHENEQFTFPSSQPKKLCCTCTKSRCLKKYCECFANKEYCAGCECVNCYNLPKFREMVKRSLEFACGKKDNDEDSANESQKSELTCNCTKSNCTKKYCECYKAGEGCKELCRCINCENNKELLTIQKKKEVVSEVEREKRKIFRNPLNFIIEGTSVYIYNEDISITQRKEIPNKKDLNINNVNNVNNVNNLSNPSNSMNLNNLNNLNIINQNEKELTKDSQSRKNSKIFQVQANLESASKIRNFNFNSNETPKLSNKKRRRITKDEDNTNSNVKSASTHFQTPIFTTTTSEKTTGNKKKVNLDKHIVKNLDKIY